MSERNATASQQSLDDRWKELETELSWFGARLDELQARREVIGAATIDDLQQRYEDVAGQVVELRDASEQEKLDQGPDDSHSLSATKDAVIGKIDDVGATIADNVHTTREAVKAKMSELGEQAEIQRQRASEAASETSVRIQAATSDVGHGFRAAWDALKQDLEKASAKLSGPNDK